MVLNHKITVQSLMSLRRRNVTFEDEDGTLIGRKCIYCMELADDDDNMVADEPNVRGRGR